MQVDVIAFENDAIMASMLIFWKIV